MICVFHECPLGPKPMFPKLFSATAQQEKNEKFRGTHEQSLLTSLLKKLSKSRGTLENFGKH